jgi:uncharacterized damage-inducible protein DinB
MITPDYCRMMAHYNEWMNVRIYTVCSKLQDSDRRQDRGLFFGSLHATLNHLLFGDMVWLSRFRGHENDVPSAGSELFADFEPLWNSRKDWDGRIIQWATGVDESWLAEEYTFVSRVDNCARTKPAWVLVTHMYNHQTHHRGQVTAALSQMGYDYGATDIPFMP